MSKGKNSKKKLTPFVETPNHPEGEQGEADITYTASQSSVEIARTAKGHPTFSVKIYDFDPEAAAERAIDIYKQLDEAFPFSGD